MLVGAAAFGVLSSVADLPESERRVGRSQEVLVVANHLERPVVDLETGLRGYLITGTEFCSLRRSLRPPFPNRRRLCNNSPDPRHNYPRSAVGRPPTPTRETSFRSRRGPARPCLGARSLKAE